MKSWFCVRGPPCQTMRIPSITCSTAFERNGSTEHITPIRGSVKEKGVRCDRATLLNVPYPKFFRQPVTPAAEWSFIVGTLIIFVNPVETMLAMYERVSDPPYAGRDQRLVAADVHFIRVAVVNQNVPR